MKNFKKSMGKFLDSKKTKGLIVGLLTTVLTTYVFKDNPELAEKCSLMVVGLTSTYLLGQGAADAFGGDAYHGKKKK